MTVRIAKILGLEKILELSKELNIYEDIPESFQYRLVPQKLHLLI